MASTLAAFDPDLVRRLDGRGPRYTSYPTADRFVEAFGPEAYRAMVERCAAVGIERALALYVHLPFCRHLCFYCGCNKIVTRDRAKAARYLDYLGREIELQAALFGAGRVVGGMHWGGGTPTYHDIEALRGLWQRLARHFEFAAGGDYSIEADPRTVDGATIAALRELGFNRVSFGVQDLDPEVQAAVHRVQSEAQTFGAIDAARRAGFASVNVDLIYGLPKQDLLRFNRTLARVVEARPDRIALYNYAHLPALFAPQRRIDAADLPRPETKLELLALAVKRFAAAGYDYIGMDHFALPGDALAVARRQGRLQRDFQGYSTRPAGDLVGLGVSAIGAVGPSYSQNFRTLQEYYERLDRGELPVMRGIELGVDDLLRRAVIQALMCDVALSKRALGIAYLVDFDAYFERELGELAEFERLGLIATDGEWISVTPRGRFVVRSICQVFDRYIGRARDGARYSRVI